MRLEVTRSPRRGPSAVSPDGRRVATAHARRQVVVWEEATGDELFTLTTSEAGMGRPVWSPDGTRILTLASGVARLWDATDGAPLGEVPALRQARSVTWGEGGVVADIDGDHMICFDEHWEEVVRWPLPHDWDRVNRPSPDGWRLAFIDVDEQLSIVELHGGELVARLDLSANTLAWHPEGRQVAVTVPRGRHDHGTEWVTQVLDLNSQQLLREIPGLVALQGFSPDGGRLVVHDDGKARVVDIAAGESVELPGEDGDWDEVLWHPSGRLLLPAEEPTVPVAAAFRAQDGAVVVLDSSGSVQLWDREGQQLGGFNVGDRPVRGLLQLSPDGTRVLLGRGAALEVRGLDGGLVAGLDHDPYPQDAAWSPDGTRVISSGRDGTVRVWDATTGEVLHTLPGGMPYGRVAVAWSPDGAEVMAGPVGESGRSFQIWDAASGDAIRRLEGVETTHELRWSSDGGLILGSQLEGDSGLRWVSSTGQPLPPLVVQDPDGMFEDGFDTPWLAIWDPTGTRLATAWDDCVVRVWTSGSAEPSHMFVGHLNPVTHMAWDDSGELLLSVSDEAVKLWNAATGVAVLHLSRVRLP
ncbi:MAG: WD40 repeat domain-containing protein [Arachnia propionica]|uniref:WD40 repeat domain-containing protein n=1 Tax=Arachnia propionica TaxID=1750 RepID=UPI002708C60B|nr:WD40 repeat domain-containing protein [Arachnia propionica]